MKMDRMGDKLAENMLNAIDKSRRPGLANLIYALGIRNVGYHLAGVLAKQFKSIENLASQTIERLIQIHEIGPIVAQSISNFFQNPKNRIVIQKLKAGGIRFPTDRVEVGKTPLEGKTFVLTGGLDSFTRDEARIHIESMGGRVTSSVSKKTDFVVVGKDPGSKYHTAQGLGITTLNENEFKEFIGKECEDS
jgi:DNA ligase (NAD+)